MNMTLNKHFSNNVPKTDCFLSAIKAFGSSALHLQITGFWNSNNNQAGTG